MMERHSKRASETAASLGCATENASAENLRACTQNPNLSPQPADGFMDLAVGLMQPIVECLQTTS